MEKIKHDSRLVLALVEPTQGSLDPESFQVLIQRYQIEETIPGFRSWNTSFPSSWLNGFQTQNNRTAYLGLIAELSKRFDLRGLLTRMDDSNEFNIRGDHIGDATVHPAGIFVVETPRGFMEEAGIPEVASYSYPQGHEEMCLIRASLGSILEATHCGFVTPKREQIYPNIGLITSEETQMTAIFIKEVLSQ